MAERAARLEFKRLDVAERGQAATDRLVSAARILPRMGATAGLCALLGACNAHERATTASVAPAPAPQTVASGSPTAQAPAQPVATAAARTQAASGPVVAVARTTAADRKLGRAGGGLASWYGDRFHGRPTANGERFDMGGLTAAHRTLPLPSYVRVTNVSNGRSIVVRVNDRGPFHGSRVIDVSRRTADLLGFRSSGVGNVKLDYVGRAPKSRSDDRRLLASYQEFGRPTFPPGVQMAAMSPVADSDLAAEASGPGGGAFAVASAAVTTSVSAVRSSATAVASGATAAVRTILPGAAPAPRQPAAVAVATAERAPAGEIAAAPTAYAAPQPLLASAPAAITASRPATGKRVIQPNAAPVLASSAPDLRSTRGASAAPSGVDVSSRISAGFDSFGGSTTTVRTGASATFEGLR